MIKSDFFINKIQLTPPHKIVMHGTNIWDKGDEKGLRNWVASLEELGWKKQKIRLADDLGDNERWDITLVNADKNLSRYRITADCTQQVKSPSRETAPGFQWTPAKTICRMDFATMCTLSEKKGVFRVTCPA